jgi:3D (Asp-Asp-Asp) domain-containing protein
VKKTIIILIFLIILAILAISFGVRECINLGKQQEYLNQIEEQQTKYLKNIEEWTVNYNDLYSDYNELYLKYADLHANLTANKWNDFIVTGYSASDPQQGTTGLIFTGFDLNNQNVKNIPIIATDPSVIPLYSIVEIQGYGPFIALDIGGEIKGNRIDILFNDKFQAKQFGVKPLLVRIIR